MASEKKQVSLTYQPALRITKEDKQLLRNAFKENDALMKVLVKIFLPSGFDAETPIEYLQNDILNFGREWAQVPEMELKALVVARQDLIKYVSGSLMQIKNFAYEPAEETAEEVMNRISKNSTK